MYEELFKHSVNDHYIQKYINFIVSVPKDRTIEIGENHHILPKALFPEYEFESWNIIRLNLREHFIVHHMLFRGIGGPMARAFYGMGCKECFNSKSYQKVKEDARRESSELTKRQWEDPVFRSRVIDYMSNRTISKETREKIGAASRGKKRPPRTEETKQKIAASSLGKKMSAEAKRKMSIVAKRRAKVYTFYNEDGTKFEGTVIELTKTFGINKQKAYAAFKKEKPYHGWHKKT